MQNPCASKQTQVCYRYGLSSALPQCLCQDDSPVVGNCGEDKIAFCKQSLLDKVCILSTPPSSLLLPVLSLSHTLYSAGPLFGRQQTGMLHARRTLGRPAAVRVPPQRRARGRRHHQQRQLLRRRGQPLPRVLQDREPPSPPRPVGRRPANAQQQNCSAWKACYRPNLLQDQHQCLCGGVEGAKFFNGAGVAT